MLTLKQSGKKYRAEISYRKEEIALVCDMCGQVWPYDMMDEDGEPIAAGTMRLETIEAAPDPYKVFHGDLVFTREL